jgi:hypothetical protein
LGGGTSSPFRRDDLMTCGLANSTFPEAFGFPFSDFEAIFTLLKIEIVCK